MLVWFTLITFAKKGWKWNEDEKYFDAMGLLSPNAIETLFSISEINLEPNFGFDRSLIADYFWDGKTLFTFKSN